MEKEESEVDQNWSLNGFYDAGQLTGLYEAISLRESCRSFASAPTEEQWALLQSAAENLALPATRIALGMCDNSLFQPFGGMLIKFENVQRYAAVIVKDEKPESMVNAGIGGEMFMLAAVQAGLGGVWVMGTYKRGKLDVKLEEGETVKALIALGVPTQPPVPPLQRKRKEISQICATGFEQAPACFREVAMVVRVAPSAMNVQPWRLTYVPENMLDIEVRRPMQRIDLGIALCHAVLALGQTPATFSLSPDGLSARLTV